MDNYKLRLNYKIKDGYLVIELTDVQPGWIYPVSLDEVSIPLKDLKEALEACDDD